MSQVRIVSSEAKSHHTIHLLNRQLASYYLLKILTRVYRSHACRLSFSTLQQLLKDQQQDLTLNINLIIDKVRHLGGYPLELADFLTQYDDVGRYFQVLDSKSNITLRLVKEREQIIYSLQKAISQHNTNFYIEGIVLLLASLVEHQRKTTETLCTVYKIKRPQQQLSSVVIPVAA